MRSVAYIQPTWPANPLAEPWSWKHLLHCVQGVMNCHPVIQELEHSSSLLTLNLLALAGCRSSLVFLGLCAWLVREKTSMPFLDRQIKI